MRLSKIPNVKFVLGFFFHVSHSKVEPLLMASGVSVNVHKHIILVCPSHFPYFLNVSTFEMAINKERGAFHHILLLKLKIL